MHYSLSLQTMMVLPPNFFDSGASNFYNHLAHASTTKAPILSRHVRAHTYIKYNRSEFWYPHFLGSIGVSTFPNPNKFIYKIWIMYLTILDWKPCFKRNKFHMFMHITHDIHIHTMHIMITLILIACKSVQMYTLWPQRSSCKILLW